MRGTAYQRGIGLSLLGLIIAAAILVPWIAKHNPNATSIDVIAAPSAEHWLGTDDLGRDVFSRVLYGARISLVVGVVAATIAALIGIPLGLVAGYAQGRTDTLIVQVIDLFMSLPSLIIALIVTVLVGASLTNIVLVIGFLMWPEMARLVRGQVRSIREMLFIEAARCIGCSPLRILWRHIWPNVVRIVAAQLSVMISAAIFTAASLGFLGFGLPPPAPDWGSMVQSGFDYLAVAPLLSLAPGGAVMLTVFSFYLLGRAVD